MGRESYWPTPRDPFPEPPIPRAAPRVRGLHLRNRAARVPSRGASYDTGYNRPMPRHEPSGEPSDASPERAGPTDPGNGEMVRRVLRIDSETDRLLREEAHRTGSTEAAIVRALLRRHYGLD